MANSTEDSQYGYPTPGRQKVTGTDVMNHVFFMSDEDWETARESKSFDYVIIGSSFCALAFVTKVLKNNPQAKCIILERGHYFHPEHFQNLPPAYMLTLTKGISETFPWNITDKTHNGEFIKWQHGMHNYFGGRSFFWSGWCPEPTDDEMEDWPPKVAEIIHRYFPDAKELLNVVPANEICGKEHRRKNAIFGILQDKLDELLADAASKVDTVTRVIPAPLAVDAKHYRHEDYQKYAVQGPLLETAIVANYFAESTAVPPLQFAVDCTVTKINYEGSKATELETSKGKFKLGDAQLILAMGTLPPTTLVLNSFPPSVFPRLKKVGKRFTSHFISSIIARIPSEEVVTNLSDLEIGAVYIAGVNEESRHQFHIQLSAVYDRNVAKNVHDTIRHLPDIVAAPSLEQLVSSDGYIVFVCACLGQLDHNNSENWFEKNERSDPTTNVTLQVVANDVDNALWDTMDSTTFSVLENTFGSNKLEYWHVQENATGDHWIPSSHPPKEQIRVPGLVHEASTMWIGDDDDAPVGLDYKLKGVDNVYITGASLWPTGASWNPTGVMAALATHLADQLTSPK